MNIIKLTGKAITILFGIAVSITILSSCGIFAPSLSGPVDSEYVMFSGGNLCSTNGFHIVDALEPNDKIMVVQAGYCNKALTMDGSFMTNIYAGLYMSETNIATLNPDSDWPALQVSPDGRYIAGETYSVVNEFAIKYVIKTTKTDWEENKLNSDLFIIKELGRERQIIDIALTKKYWKYIGHVEWAPDSSKVYYASSLAEPPSSAKLRGIIDSYNLTTGKKEIVYESPTTIYGFKISPDSEKILIRIGMHGLSSGLVVYNMRTRECKDVFYRWDPKSNIGDITDFAWAPDSNQFIFTDTHPQGGLFITDITNPARENQRFLFRTYYDGTSNSLPPACRPNSKEAAFWDYKMGGLSIINYETGEVKRGILFVKKQFGIGGDGQLYHLTWSNDGRYLTGTIFVGSGIPGTHNALFDIPAVPILRHYLFVVDFQKKEIFIPFDDGPQYAVPVYVIDNPESIRKIKEVSYEYNNNDIKKRITDIKNLWGTLSTKDKHEKIRLLKIALTQWTPTNDIKQEAEAQIKQWEAELAGQPETPKPK